MRFSVITNSFNDSAVVSWRILKHGLPKVAVFIALLTSGCQENDSSSVPENLQGTWSTGCLLIQQDSIEEYQNRTMVIGSDTFSESVESFDSSDNECANPLETRSAKGDLTYETATAQSAANIDLTYTEVKLSLATDEVVERFNDSSDGTAVCGGGWEKDEYKTLTENLCGDTYAWHAGLLVYDIYRLRSGALYFGVKSDDLPEEPTSRPQDIDVASKMSRVDSALVAALIKGP